MVQGLGNGALNPRQARLKFVNSLVVASLAGLAHAASMGSPWGGQPVWLLQLLAMALLVCVLDRSSSPRQAAWLGWVFSVSWLCGSFWWLYISMHTYGGLNSVLTGLSVFALAAVLALYYALAAYAFKALRHAKQAYAAIIFAALWMLAELCRSLWFTGFGWGAAGYAHLGGLGIFAKYIGVFGVGALAAYLAAILALVVGDRRQKNLTADQLWALAPASAITLLAVVLQFTQPQFSVPGPTLEVALLQGNISQDEKFQPGSGIKDSLEWYGAQIKASKAALIVAPETAIPLLPDQLPDGYWDDLTRPFAIGDRALLTGMPLGNFSQGYTNSVVGIKPDAARWRYDKHHLVPFGEFIPPLFKWFTQMMNIPLGDFNRGDVGQTSFEWQNQRLAANICYEDLYGDELGARFLDATRAPTIFVNVSNIGWFGNSIAIDQHLSISRMRAMEFERPFIRATNTGATVIIDHTGRVTHSLPRHTQGVLTGQVQGRTGTLSNGFGITPYAWWVARFGLWPLWLLGAGVVLLAVVFKRESSR
jgi:apolipoprotein N-acyltransferase